LISSSASLGDVTCAFLLDAQMLAGDCLAVQRYVGLLASADNDVVGLDEVVEEMTAVLVDAQLWHLLTQVKS
jgi:hypothetical protein